MLTMAAEKLQSCTSLFLFCSNKAEKKEKKMIKSDELELGWSPSPFHYRVKDNFITPLSLAHSIYNMPSPPTATEAAIRNY